MYRKSNPQEVHRLILPREGEFIGFVYKALGASKFMINCSDEKQRICSIPGRLKRRFWIKEGDMVLVKPWVVQGDEKGDIIWRYSILDKDLLKKKGLVLPK